MVRRFVVEKRPLCLVARYAREYLHDAELTGEALREARALGADLVTFVDRSYVEPRDLPLYWEWDNVALLRITSYEDWWRSVGKKTRNMVRKAKKLGVAVEVLKGADSDTARGIWRVYNETPYRQGRWFPGYGKSLAEVERALARLEGAELFVAKCQGEVIGFAVVAYGDRAATISSILSMVKHFDKAPNNALIAKVVERCAERGVPNLIYARMGNHPSLDRFKMSNGFVKFPLKRYFVPLTVRGAAAIRLRGHRPPQDVVPEAIKPALIPLYNFLSRKLRL